MKIDIKCSFRFFFKIEQLVYYMLYKDLSLVDNLYATNDLFGIILITLK